MSGGFQRLGSNIVMGPMIKYALGLTGKTKPKICYIGTASGDAAQFITGFYDACLEQTVTPSHLQLFTAPNVSDVRRFLLNQDTIWVPGGSVANLLAVWQVHGLGDVLREAWEQGIVLAGSSAGSICWHTSGTTDSFGPELRAVTNGLGFLSYANGVHYDTEEQRRPFLQSLVAQGTLGEAYATDEGTGLHYIGDTLHKAISDTPDKWAYHVVKDGDGVKETKLPTELLI